MAQWDQQKGEGKNFSHFVHYRDLGPDRTLAKASQAAGLNESYIRQVAADWKWTDRCAAYDAHLDALTRKAYASELEKQAKLRARAYNALMGKSLEALTNAPQARLGEIATAMKVAAEGMRLEAGLATEKVEHEVTLTDDERLRRLEALAAAGEDRAGVARPHAGGAGGGRPAPGGVAVH